MREGTRYKIISRLLNLNQNTVAAVVRRYRKTYTVLSITEHTIHYLCNLALKNRGASASDLAQGLSVETGL